MLFISMSSYCHSTPEWLDSNDVCMSGGSWACGGGTTKERGHCGYSKWGNGSYHLMVGSPPFSVRNYNFFCSQLKDTVQLLMLFHSGWVVLHWISSMRVHFTIEALARLYHLRMNSCVIATPHHGSLLYSSIFFDIENLVFKLEWSRWIMYHME